jgi:hypothetical protein
MWPGVQSQAVCCVCGGRASWALLVTSSLADRPEGVPEVCRASRRKHGARVQCTPPRAAEMEQATAADAEA